MSGAYNPAMGYEMASKGLNISDNFSKELYKEGFKSLLRNRRRLWQENRDDGGILEKNFHNISGYCFYMSSLEYFWHHLMKFFFKGCGWVSAPLLGWVCV